jgi:hypothetical protein
VPMGMRIMVVEKYFSTTKNPESFQHQYFPIRALEPWKEVGSLRDCVAVRGVHFLWVV